jgi:hypothetical protein
LLTLHSFEPERVVYVVRTKSGDAEVIFKRLTRQLWTVLSEKLHEQAGGGNIVPFDDASQQKALAAIDVPVERRAATIDVKTAELLTGVWSRLLARVSYPRDRPRVGAEVTLVDDGISYHVASFTPGVGYRTGFTTSPEKGTLTADLVLLGEELERYALAAAADRRTLEQALRRRARALQARAGGR